MQPCFCTAFKRRGVWGDSSCYADRANLATKDDAPRGSWLAKCLEGTWAHLSLHHRTPREMRLPGGPCVGARYWCTPYLKIPKVTWLSRAIFSGRLGSYVFLHVKPQLNIDKYANLTCKITFVGIQEFCMHKRVSLDLLMIIHDDCGHVEYWVLCCEWC